MCRGEISKASKLWRGERQEHPQGDADDLQVARKPILGLQYARRFRQLPNDDVMHKSGQPMRALCKNYAKIQALGTFFSNDSSGA